MVLAELDATFPFTTAETTDVRSTIAPKTLFAAMLVRTRSRDVLLPILLYPITVPVIIAGVRGTAALLDINPHTLRAKMRKLGVDWSRFRD